MTKVSPYLKIASNPKYEMQKWLGEARQTVKKYLTELYKWHRYYALKNPSKQFHPLFVESLHKMDYIEYLSDILSCGLAEYKLDLYEIGQAVIKKIRQRLNELADVQCFEKHKAI